MIRYIAIFYLLLSPGFIHAQGEESEEFAQSIFSALKSKSSKKFERLLMPKEALKNFVDNSDKEGSYYEKSYNIDTLHHRYVQQAHASFEGTIKHGKKVGLRWRRFKYIDFEISRFTNYEELASKGKLIISASNKNIVYQIGIGSWVQISRKYYVLDPALWWHLKPPSK